MEESVKLDCIENESSLFEQIKREFDLKDRDAKQYSPLALAYIGDGIYDLVIRTIVVEQGNAPVNKLHKKVTNLVKAQAQAEIAHVIYDQLTPEEEAVFKRGRNAKSFTSAKNATMTEYRTATGFEALIGFLYLNNQMIRVLRLVKIGLERIDMPK